jgi:hypothetical protein
VRRCEQTSPILVGLRSRPSVIRPVHAALSSARPEGRLPSGASWTQQSVSALLRGVDFPPVSRQGRRSCSTPKRLLSTSARSALRSLGAPRTRARHRRDGFATSLRLPTCRSPATLGSWASHALSNRSSRFAPHGRTPLADVCHRPIRKHTPMDLDSRPPMLGCSAYAAPRQLEGGTHAESTPDAVAGARSTTASCAAGASSDSGAGEAGFDTRWTCASTPRRFAKGAWPRSDPHQTPRVAHPSRPRRRRRGRAMDAPADPKTSSRACPVHRLLYAARCPGEPPRALLREKERVPLHSRCLPPRKPP